MTTPVCVRRRIRQLDRQGLSHREISRKLGVSRTTVVKYANHGDCSPKPLGSGHAGRSLVDAGYSAVVDGWPAADLRMPVKQRHTATRVYERLVAECGFTGSYSSVRRWVKRWRREHRVESDGFAELEWRREARRSISARPGPWSPESNAWCISWWCRSRIRTCAGWSPFPARPRSACARVCCGSSSAWAWRLGWWCSTTPPVWAIAGRTARPPGPACSPCSARITGSGRGSATRIPATGRAVWRTPSASSGAT